MPKCVVKSCKHQAKDLFASPEDKLMLKKWQAAVGTTDEEFLVCEAHFTKKDMVIKKNLKHEAVPVLNLSDEIFQLENKCCGVCLEDIEDKLILSQENRNLFMEISDFHPLTDFICPTCQFSLEKYKEFKTSIQLMHAKIRDDAFKAVQQQEKVFDCDFCSFSSNELEILKHIEENHSFFCEYCSFHCRIPEDLANHIRLLHKEKEVDIVINDIFYCQCCTQNFPDRAKYIEHYNIHKFIVKQECELNIESEEVEIGCLSTKYSPKPLQIESIIGGAIFESETAMNAKKKITPQRTFTFVNETFEENQMKNERKTEQSIASETLKNSLKRKKEEMIEIKPTSPIEVIKKIKPILPEITEETPLGKRIRIGRFLHHKSSPKTLYSSSSVELQKFPNILKKAPRKTPHVTKDNQINL